MPNILPKDAIEAYIIKLKLKCNGHYKNSSCLYDTSRFVYVCIDSMADDVALTSNLVHATKFETYEKARQSFRKNLSWYGLSKPGKQGDELLEWKISKYQLVELD